MISRFVRLADENFIAADVRLHAYYQLVSTSSVRRGPCELAGGELLRRGGGTGGRTAVLLLCQWRRAVAGGRWCLLSAPRDLARVELRIAGSPAGWSCLQEAAGGSVPGMLVCSCLNLVDLTGVPG